MLRLTGHYERRLYSLLFLDLFPAAFCLLTISYLDPWKTHFGLDREGEALYYTCLVG